MLYCVACFKWKIFYLYKWAPGKTKHFVVIAATTTKPVVAKTSTIAKQVTAEAPAEASTRSLRSRKQD